MIRLFVIENHETIIVSGLRQLFRPRRNNIEVSGSAVNVSVALKSPVISSVDVIILDLWIPGEKPLDNVRMLKEAFPDKPILVYTSEDSSVWMRKMMVAGVNGYVIKEAIRSKLKSAIESLAAGGSWFTDSLTAEDLEIIDQEIMNQGNTLSPVQKKILTLLIKGENQKEIAAILNVKTKAIEKTLASLRTKYNAKTTLELIHILSDKALI